MTLVEAELDNRIKEAMTRKEDAIRDGQQALAELRAKLQQMEERIAGYNLEFDDLRVYKALGQQEQANQLQVLRQRLEDMRDSHAEAMTQMRDNFQRATQRITTNLGVRLERAKDLASDRVLQRENSRSMAAHADARWLEQELATHQSEQERLIESCTVLEIENLELLARLSGAEVGVGRFLNVDTYAGAQSSASLDDVSDAGRQRPGVGDSFLESQTATARRLPPTTVVQISEWEDEPGGISLAASPSTMTAAGSATPQIATMADLLAADDDDHAGSDGGDGNNDGLRPSPRSRIGLLRSGRQTVAEEEEGAYAEADSDPATSDDDSDDDDDGSLLDESRDARLHRSQLRATSSARHRSSALVASAAATGRVSWHTAAQQEANSGQPAAAVGRATSASPAVSHNGSRPSPVVQAAPVSPRPAHSATGHRRQQQPYHFFTPDVRLHSAARPHTAALVNSTSAATGAASSSLSRLSRPTTATSRWRISRHGEPVLDSVGPTAAEQAAAQREQAAAAMRGPLRQWAEMGSALQIRPAVHHVPAPLLQSVAAAAASGQRASNSKSSQAGNSGGSERNSRLQSAAASRPVSAKAGFIPSHEPLNASRHATTGIIGSSTVAPSPLATMVLEQTVQRIVLRSRPGSARVRFSDGRRPDKTRARPVSAVGRADV